MVERDAKDVRLEVFHGYESTFASAPIRLMSRTVSRMQALGYDDKATAIGDMDFRTVPEDDPEDPRLRCDWEGLVCSAFEHASGWLQQLGVHPMGYNLDSVGAPALVSAWSRMWQRNLGLEFANRAGEPYQIAVFHGGNQALQAALLGVAERRRTRVGTDQQATVLVPLPAFSCPLDQIALQGMQAWMLPPGDPTMDVDVRDLDTVPDDVDIDGVYIMPISNPTGRTQPPERLAAFISGVLDRWPHAGVILDSVYLRLHPQARELVQWYTTDPRFADSVVFIDSLSKTHGVTGLRSGVLMTRGAELMAGVTRYAQNVMAGPSNMMQATVLAMIAPYLTGDEDLMEVRRQLPIRIGRHLQRRRRLLLAQAFDSHRPLLDAAQPLIPEPETFDWEGSMYAVPRLSDHCLELAEERGVSPTVAFYLETGIGGVPLSGFCSNPNLLRHQLLLNAEDERFTDFFKESQRYVRLSFGMTPPPAV